MKQGDPPNRIAKKIKRAVTDTDNEVRFDPEHKPGVSNLLSILAAATGGDPAKLADDYDMYGPLKADAAEAVVAMLEPIQARYADLVDDRATIADILRTGAEKARAIAVPTLERAHRAVGLLPPTAVVSG